MSEHATHTMHRNSLQAYAASDFTARECEILAIYLASDCPLTDREVQARLGYDERGMVQPRITELRIAGYLWETGKTKDPKTRKPVRVCAPTSLARKAAGL